MGGCLVHSQSTGIWEALATMINGQWVSAVIFLIRSSFRPFDVWEFSSASGLANTVSNDLSFEKLGPPSGPRSLHRFQHYF